eukprot:12653457-Alexandrium_andersonii.AAC.1
MARSCLGPRASSSELPRPACIPGAVEQPSHLCRDSREPNLRCGGRDEPKNARFDHLFMDLG